MDKTGWKTTTRKRHSAFIPLVEGGRIYPINMWVRPKAGFGPLAVFADLDSALKWAERLALEMGLHPRRCEYKPSQSNAMWQSDQVKRPLKDAPPGTRLACAIKCLE